MVIFTIPEQPQSQLRWLPSSQQWKGSQFFLLLFIVAKTLREMLHSASRSNFASAYYWMHRESRLVSVISRLRGRPDLPEVSGQYSGLYNFRRCFLLRVGMSPMTYVLTSVNGTALSNFMLNTSCNELVNTDSTIPAKCGRSCTLSLGTSWNAVCIRENASEHIAAVALSKAVLHFSVIDEV